MRGRSSHEHLPASIGAASSRSRPAPRRTVRNGKIVDELPIGESQAW